MQAMQPFLRKNWSAAIVANEQKTALAGPKGTAHLRKLADNEDRRRLSLRLNGNADDKLNDLARFRGLDRNTAVCVAIVQDWIACFGPPGSSTS